jgi:site-specific DNA recombinase
LFDQSGEPLVATQAVKQGRRYRYYVSRSLQHGGDASANDGMRIPARDIEALVCGHLASMVADPVALFCQAGVPLPSPETLSRVLAKGDRVAKSMRGSNEAATPPDIVAVVERTISGSDEITIATRVPALFAVLGYPPDQPQPQAQRARHADDPARWDSRLSLRARCHRHLLAGAAPHNGNRTPSLIVGRARSK